MANRLDSRAENMPERTFSPVSHFYIVCSYRGASGNFR
jgi:hypothetical protein